MPKQYRIMERCESFRSVVVEVPDEMDLADVAGNYSFYELYQIYDECGDIDKIEIWSLNEPVSINNQLGLENDKELVHSEPND